MAKTNEAQLALIELPPSTKHDAARARRRVSLATTAEHCNALLARLDRLALSEDARAEQLARLFTAVEHAHASRTALSRDEIAAESLASGGRATG